MESLIILLSPLISFILISFFGKSIGDKISGIITSLAGAVSFVFSLGAVFRSLEEPYHIKLYKFLPLEGYDLSVGFYFDPLSSITSAVVTFVATLIFVYSIGYMHHEFGNWTFKFYAYLSLFLFAMLLIVLSDNLLGIFFGWEGVGLASYLLIGYYHQQLKASNASLEAFIMNRIGDWLFIFGIISCFLIFNSLDILTIFNKIPSADPYFLGLATLLLFGGAVGKSGQLPLHTWLPNAMAGPTPVSALLHAATMVAAGVYMIARLYPLFDAAPQTLKFVALIGGLTALFAALAATSHTDIKKIIAFSTMSQLGYMFLGLGVGDPEGAMYHLTTHAFFKALLFLAAGSVITAFHHKLYDIYSFGGLKRYMPVTYAGFTVGALSLAGVFPLSGFWSKDRLIGSYYEVSLVWGLLGSVVAFITAYYIFREGFVVFHGEERFRNRVGYEIREVGSEMKIPVLVLLVMSVIAGLAEGWYMKAVGGMEKSIHLDVALSSFILASLGIASAYVIFVKRIPNPEKAYSALKILHTTLKEQFFTEKLYHRVLAVGYLKGSKIVHTVGEKHIVDGFVNLLATAVQNVGKNLRFAQPGKLNWYAFGMVGGLSFLVVLLFVLLFTE